MSSVPLKTASAEHVHHAQASARPTFQQVFAGSFPYVCRTLARLGVQADDVEDVAQEVFLAVHRHFDAFDPSRRVDPWLFGFCMRLAANYRRLARHRHEDPGSGRSEKTDFQTPEAQLRKQQMREVVLRVLQRLPLAQRYALIMHDIDGMSAREIADVLAISLNTVYSRVRLGRKTFRRLFAQERFVGGAP